MEDEGEGEDEGNGGGSAAPVAMPHPLAVRGHSFRGVAPAPTAPPAPRAPPGVAPRRTATPAATAAAAAAAAAAAVAAAAAAAVAAGDGPLSSTTEPSYRERPSGDALQLYIRAIKFERTLEANSDGMYQQLLSEALRRSGSADSHARALESLQASVAQLRELVPGEDAERVIAVLKSTYELSELGKDLFGVSDELEIDPLVAEVAAWWRSSLQRGDDEDEEEDGWNVDDLDDGET